MGAWSVWGGGGYRGAVSGWMSGSAYPKKPRKYLQQIRHMGLTPTCLSNHCRSSVGLDVIKPGCITHASLHIWISPLSSGCRNYFHWPSFFEVSFLVALTCRPQL